MDTVLRRVPKNPIFTAIDTSDMSFAKKLFEQVGDLSGGIKIGSEFFTAFGANGVNDLIGEDTPLFLDLKFHDIPNTIAGAVRSSIKNLRPNILTVHASGGRDMMKAATDTAKEHENGPLIFAVTVLTSLNILDMGPYNGFSVDDVAMLFARDAKESGIDGIVCSSHELIKMKNAYKDSLKFIVPGIRPENSEKNDQKRTKAPREAVADGADFLVIGRPITSAKDPRKAITDILEEIQ